MLARELAVQIFLGYLLRRSVLLLGPGRWGTRDAWLGIPVAFADINNVAAICEIVTMHESLVPDVSLGTHFINELIEADMLYFALFPGHEGNQIDERLLRRQANRLSRIVPDARDWSAVIRVADMRTKNLSLYADAEQQRVTVTL